MGILTTKTVSYSGLHGNKILVLKKLSKKKEF